MGKRKTTKPQRKTIVIHQALQPSIAMSPTPNRFTFLKKIPRLAWALFSPIVAMISLYALYPTLTINQDYSIDTIFPYNTSFSITNEGLWPITDLSVVCAGDFIMLPWTTDPSDKSSMNLHTATSEFRDFPKILMYKRRITLPCNHNVIANGHRIAPNAKLQIKTSYRIAGTNFTMHKTFEFSTIEGWHGQQFWQYQ
jgi:hypothetical protein